MKIDENENVPSPNEERAASTQPLCDTLNSQKSTAIKGGPVTRGSVRMELRSKKKIAASEGKKEKLDSPQNIQESPVLCQPQFHSAVVPKVTWANTDLICQPKSSPLVSNLAYYKTASKAPFPEGFVNGESAPISQAHELMQGSLECHTDNNFLDHSNPFRDFNSVDFGETLQTTENSVKKRNFGTQDFESNVECFQAFSAPSSSASMMEPSQFMSSDNFEMLFSNLNSNTSTIPSLTSNEIQTFDFGSQQLFNPFSIFDPSPRNSDQVNSQLFGNAQISTEFQNNPDGLLTKYHFPSFGLPSDKENNLFSPENFHNMPQFAPLAQGENLNNIQLEFDQKANKSENSTGDTSQDTMNSIDNSSLRSWQLFKEMTRYNELAEKDENTKENPGDQFSGNILDVSGPTELFEPSVQSNSMEISTETITLVRELPEDPVELAEWEEFKRNNSIQHEPCDERSNFQTSLPGSSDQEPVQLMESWNQFKEKTGYCSETAETPIDIDFMAGQFLTPGTPFLHGPTIGSRTSSVCAADIGYLTPIQAVYAKPSPFDFESTPGSIPFSNPSNRVASPPQPLLPGRLQDTASETSDIPDSLSRSSSISSDSVSGPPATPLLPSPRLSQLAGCQVFLKMEGLQLGGTHKIRGLWKWVADMSAMYGSGLRMVVGALPNMSIACSAAVAYHNQRFPASFVSLTAVVPSCAPQRLIQLLTAYGADCCQFGQDWDHAKSHAHVLSEKNKAQNQASLLMPPKDLVSGLVSLSHEIKEQIRIHPRHSHIDAILCPVGSGSLLASLTQEFGQTGSVSIVGVETASTDLFHTSLSEGKSVCHPPQPTLDSLSLSDSLICHKVIEMANAFPIIPLVVSDDMAANATLQFSEDHNTLIEPASGTALSPIYHKLLPSLLPGLQPTSTIVVIVTGGNLVNLSDLTRFSKQCSHPPIQAKSRDQLFLHLDRLSPVSSQGHVSS